MRSTRRALGGRLRLKGGIAGLVMLLGGLDRRMHQRGSGRGVTRWSPWDLPWGQRWGGNCGSGLRPCRQQMRPRVTPQDYPLRPRGPQDVERQSHQQMGPRCDDTAGETPARLMEATQPPVQWQVLQPEARPQVRPEYVPYVTGPPRGDEKRRKIKNTGGAFPVDARNLLANVEI